MLKRLLLLALCGLLLLSCAACGDTAQTEETEQTKPFPTRPTLSLPSTDTQQTVPVTYVPDEAVNRFILAIEDLFEMPEPENPDGSGSSDHSPDNYTPDVQRGDNPGEYILPLSECRVSVTSYPNGLSVVIVSEPGEKGLKNLLSAFKVVALAGDSGCGNDQIKAANAFIQQQTQASGSYRVSNYVQILSYLPSVQLEGTATDHRLDLLLTYYTAGGNR